MKSFLCVAALCLFLALAAAQDDKATRTAFTATNALITDSLYAGGPGRTYRADIQYWPNSGEEAIFYTIPYTLSSSSSGSFQVFEDFAQDDAIEPLFRQEGLTDEISIQEGDEVSNVLRLTREVCLGFFDHLGIAVEPDDPLALPAQKDRNDALAATNV